jgi:[amino group carrier protein]-L-2-aminoadipate 6-kinase
VTLHVLKIGGGAGVDHARVIADLAARIAQGERWIVVHGASDAANQLGEQVGYPARTLTTQGGHTSRYNDARTIALFGMAAGSVNQAITCALRSHGVNAVGLGSPNVIFARRKGALRAMLDGRQVIIRDDHSGTISGANTDLLHTLLNAGMTPVIAPLALGESYEPLNVDGDLAAAAISRDLSAQTLIILSNVAGLLRDVQAPDSLISRFTFAELDQYDSFAGGRMKKKLLAAREVSGAVPRVILADSRRDAPVTAALDGGGTHITALAQGDPT